MHLDKEQRSHNFSTVDLALDLMLIAWPVATGVGLDLSIFLPASPGFLAALADAVGLFLGYFGLALYVSRMYAAAAIRNRGKGHHRILFPSVGLGLFTGLIGITVVISGYYILADHGLPVFSSILIVLQSILFGFTFGLNYETERRRLDDRYFALPVDQPFDRAFSVLPYLLPTIVFIFPIEYFVSHSDSSPISKVLLVMLACLSTVLAGSRLDRQVFRRLKIGRKMSVTTATLTTGFMVLGLVGFGVLYAAGIGSMSKFANAESVRFMALVFFGILPVRIGAIIFSRSSRFNKVFGVLVVMGFFLTETGFITL